MFFSQAACNWYVYFGFVKIGQGKLTKHTTKQQAVMKQGKQTKSSVFSFIDNIDLHPPNEVTKILLKVALSTN
jgi:hypothetical protein